MVYAFARKAVGRLLGPHQLEESDLLLALFRRRPPGVLVEVGAHTGDGTFQRFARDGWMIHAFEPDPDNRRGLEQTAANFPNIAIIPKAVAEKSGTMTLYRSSESTGISSLVAFTEGHEAGIKVQVISLVEYLTENAIPQVDFLKIDVEGYEKFVLDGYPWVTHRPRAVLLEFEDRKTLPLGYSWRELAERLRGLGYEVLVSEWFPIVRYGVFHQWRRYASYPTELLDGNGWGNMIAVEPADFDHLKRLAQIQALRFRARRKLRPKNYG